jgi:hypothetical protein
VSWLLATSMTLGGTDSIAIGGLVFGVVIVLVFWLLTHAATYPLRLMRRFMEWAGGDD